MTRTRTILDDIYDAWRAHDLEWLASYLPEDFSHVIHVPPEVHPLGGTRRGKKAVVERLGLIFSQFDSLLLDTNDLMVERDRAAVEIHIRCRHKDTGTSLDSVKANFWTLEAGWPVILTEYYDVERFRSFMSAVEASARSNPAQLPSPRD
jgi:SnoaL-like protein